MIVPEYYINKRFGLLVTTKYIERANDRYYYECLCDCGKTKVADLYALRKGLTKSCGCLKKKSSLEKAHKACFVNGTNIGAINRGLQSNNKTGVKGVYYDTTKRKYSAFIGYKGKEIKLGYFDTLEDAAYVRKQAEKKYHKPLLEDR